MPVSPSGTLQGPPDQELDPFEPLLERPVSRRYLLFKGGILLAFGALAVRLWQMQIAQGSEYARLAEQNRQELQSIPAPRGVIYDRNGIVLAGNKASWNVTVVPANLPRDEAGRQALFAELDRLLQPPWVVFVSPRRLPAEAEAEAYGRLGSLLGQAPEEVRASVARAVAADQLPVLSDEIGRQALPAFQQQLAGLAGVTLVSQHQFRVDHSGAEPRLGLVIQANVARESALLVESRSMLLPGVAITAVAGRAYPSGTVASQVLGYVGRVDPETIKLELTPGGQPLYEQNDNAGQAGMEGLLERTLRGRKGSQLVEVDINRRIVRELSKQPPTPGDSAALTLDLGLQKAASDALNVALARAGVSTGAAVALDPTNGEVLALVSLPTFNGQEFADGISGRAYQALLNDPNQPLFNRCLGGLYAPGACLMPFVALEALRAGAANAETSHNCRGGIHVPSQFNEITRQLFRCWRGGGHGPLSLTGALAESCDVYFYNVVVPPELDARNRPYRYYEEPIGGTAIELKGIGIERINGVAAAFGFGRKAGIELAGEAAGLLPTPEWKRQQPERGEWTMGDTINVGIGQGDLQVTPLQMAVATAALANGGTIYRPRLLKSTLRLGSIAAEEQTPVQLGRVEAAREQIELVRQGMRRAVAQGTASRLSVPGVTVAAKTGTAETETADAQGNATQKPHAWFIAFAPYDNPRIALAVVLEKAGEGAAHALPVAEQMLRTYLKPA